MTGKPSRRLRLVPAVALLSALMLGLSSGPALATTPRTINVDGDLGDFDQTDRRPDDGASDSTFNPQNELDQLYVNWDSNKLYLGFDFRVQQAAVIYYIQGSGAGATTSFCNVNAFPAAAVTTEAMDYMVALYADQSLHGYTLSNGTATEDTGLAQARSSNAADGSRVTAEVGIAWTALFPGGIPSGATIKIAGALRGMNDGDLLGDVNPGGSGAVSTGNCASGNPTTISQYHLIHIDSDGNGSPDSNWDPGTDTAAGTVTPDGGPGPDVPTGSDMPTGSDVPTGSDQIMPDSVPPDGSPIPPGDDGVPDMPSAADTHQPASDLHLADFPGNDRRIGVTSDGGGGPPPPSTGCACSTGRSPSTDLGGAAAGLALLLLALAAPRRRRPRR